MGVKGLISGSVLLLCTGCSIQGGKVEPEYEFTLFKHYALTSCIAQGYSSGDVYTDSVAALNGYRERSSLPLEAFQQLNLSIQRWLQKPYRDSSGEKTEIAACADFVESNELKELFKRYK
ncbi:hypothetical protein GCM10009092_29450 [Bowmanella denitrificans]|uniref:Lipoprotein n=1 Tax=Bowmanella denitrificans TaxID=366582 RepID=A0ABP3H6A1_9ALTE